jgi:surfeit locus 1 family protein
MGYVRFGEPAGRFAAQDDLAGRRFYHFDPVAIGAALGQPGVAPYGLVVMGPPGSLPEPTQSLPRPRNSHLGYAITWYGLALSLIGVFAAFAWRMRKAA